MPTNHIDAAITTTQVDQARNALRSLEAALPFIDLTADQRQKMVRYSDKDLGYILKMLDVAEQHPEILPQGFDLEPMRRDVDALQKLGAVTRELTRVAGRLSDSLFAAGSESKGAANSVYQYLKAHNAVTGKLEDLLADVAQHYARSSAKLAAPEDK
jgi:hypothetical protein